MSSTRSSFRPIRLLLPGLVLALALAHGIEHSGTAGADTPVTGLIAPPPTPPLPVSPVTTFRRLLALAPTAREAMLASRSETQRDVLRRRLAEYEALPEEQREQRLQATDLYWHFQQLIRRPPAERESLLLTAAPALRPILEERLALWDRLPEMNRRTLRDQEQAIRYFARWKELPPTPPLPGPSIAPAPAVSLRAQRDLVRLQQLPSTARERTVQNWRQFLDTPGPRGERALQTMSTSEREEMQEVLRRFRNLPPNQRQTCIDSFARLASLPAADRADFLRRAERWEALPPADRAAWRRVVTLLPPLPPVADASAPATPPLPPTAPRVPLLTNTSSSP